MDKADLEKLKREIKSALHDAEIEIVGILEDAIAEAEQESYDSGCDDGYDKGFEAGKRSVE